MGLSTRFGITDGGLRHTADIHKELDMLNHVLFSELLQGITPKSKSRGTRLAANLFATYLLYQKNYNLKNRLSAAAHAAMWATTCSVLKVRD